MNTTTMYQKLRREVLAACKRRGHRMNRLEFHPQWSPEGPKSARIVSYANCKDCDMQVSIHTHPLPNEIDIGGEAVALNCPGPKSDLLQP